MPKYNDRTMGASKRAKHSEIIQFLARVTLPVEFELKVSTVYVLCTFTSGEFDEWDLSVINEQRLIKQERLPNARDYAVPFTLGKHSLETDLPEIAPSTKTYTATHYDAIQRCSLVSIRGSTDLGWQGSGFFHPLNKAVEEYTARMRDEEVPLIARGALFHWVMLRMAGYADSDININFSLTDSWHGRLFLSEDEQAQLATEITKGNHKAWLKDGALHGFKVDSGMLQTAFDIGLLGENYRRRDPAILSEEQRRDAHVGALYVRKRAKSIESKKKDSIVHTLSARSKSSPPMFRNGFYSAMQETTFTDDGHVKFTTMPQLVAAAFKL